MLMLTNFDRRGKRLADTMLALGERDRWLAEAASRFLPDQSSRSAARILRTRLLRYQQGAWRRERTAETVPPRRRDRLDGHFWMILRARDHVPSERTIRAAINAKKSSDRLFLAHDADQDAAR
jgi:hypothetical protein